MNANTTAEITTATICQGCANRVTPMEVLMGRCAKDGGPILGRIEDTTTLYLAAN